MCFRFFVFFVIFLLGGCMVDDKASNHQEELVDKYQWMRDKDWPKVNNEKILSFLKEENKITENFFAKLENLRNEIYEEIVARIKEDDESYPVKKDNFLYYTRSEKGKNHTIYCRKLNEAGAKEEILLDGNELSKDSPAFAMSAFKVNYSHDLLAYSVDLLGEEQYIIHIKDLKNNVNLADKIDGTIGNIVWHKKIPGFFYTKLESNWRTKKVYFHKLGESQDKDLLVYIEKDDSFSVGFSSSSDSKYLFISTSSSNENEVFMLDITNENDFTPQLLLPRKNDQQYDIDHKNNEFYISINDNGKNFRLVKLDINDINNKSKWTEIIAHNELEYLVDFDLSEKFLVVDKRINGLSQIMIFDNEGKQKNIVFPEELYSVSVGYPTYESDLLSVSYSSLTKPATLYEYDWETEKLITRKTQEIPSGYDSELYKSERKFATSKDGTKIPISLVYKKSLFSKDGQNPLYLYGYGSYGISIDPAFRSSIISLLDRGFVFAIAHIRGGDDLGYKWYDSAKFLNKKITFEDFISSAEYVINDKYTSADRLSIVGGSAGGMLVGNVINQRPELFKAAVALVPFVDVLNTMLDDTLPLTPGEYKEWGNPKEKQYYDYIKSYCPYQNVTKQNYPALFITAGLNDPRVGYWEPAKWVAKLKELNISNNVILLETEMTTGHKGMSGRYDSIKEIAKIYSFIISQMPGSEYGK
jgi:oligopeptidase B